MTMQFRRMLDVITRVRGVRGAMLVAADDGIIVAESLREGVRGNAVAALAASLVLRFRTAAEAGGAGRPHCLHLEATEGTLLAVPAPQEMLLVTVGDAGVNVGLVRLEMLRLVEDVA